MNLAEIRDLTLRLREEGAQSVERGLLAIDAAQARAVASGQAVATTQETVAKSALSVTSAYEAMHRRLDPLARAQAEFERGTSLVARALDQGASREQAARTLILLADRYTGARKAAEESVKAHAEAGAGMKLTGQQAQQLAYQLNDVAVSLAGGMSPLTVLMQQGSQITPIFGGIRQTASAAFGAVATYATAANLGIAGVGMAALATAYGFVRWRDETAALSASLHGLGRLSGETAASLSDLAARGAGAGGLSVSTGRDLAATYTGAGLSGGLTEDLIGSTRSFARLTGQDLPDAAKVLAGAFADPSKGAETLGNMLGFLDERTRVSIRSLQMQGDTMGAQRALYAALDKDLSTVTERTSGWAGAWDALKRSASDAMTAAGAGLDRIVSGPSLSERLTLLQDAERRLRRGADASSALHLPTVMEDAYQSQYGWRFGGTDDKASNLAKNLEEQRRIQKQIDRENDAAAIRAAEARLIQRSTTSAANVSSVLPDIERRRVLDAQIIDLERAMNNPALLEHMGMGFTQVADAVGLLRDRLGQVMTPLEKIRHENDLALRSIAARSVAERAALAYDRSLGGLSPEAASPAARSAADAAKAEVMARALREAEDRLRAANDNRALAGLPSYTRGRAEIEQQYRRQNELDVGSPQALARNEETRRARLAALDRSSISAPLEEANRALEAQNRLLEVNAATFGMSTEKVVAARTAQEMYNQYIAAGIPITEDLRRSVERLAAGEGRRAQAEEEMRRRQGRARGAMDDLRSTSSSVFSAVLHGRSQDVGRILADKAIDGLADQMSEMLLGPKGKMGGGIFGDFFGGLFGKAEGVGSADITAGVVNLSGPVSGLGGVSGSGGVGGEVGASGSVGGIASLVPAPLRSALGLGTSPRYDGSGVDPRLADILGKAATDSPYGARLISGMRPGDGRFHGQGLATDIQLYDRQTGAALPNYQSPETFRAYEDFAQRARGIQMRDHPELAEDFRWGGYFSGPKGKYGAMDQMHFDLGGRRVGMGGGSWEEGLTQQQRSYFPEAQSVGMDDASTALRDFTDSTQNATGGLGDFGSGLASLVGGGSGGGGGGLFGSLLKLFGFASGGVFAGGAPIAFASGGVVGSPTLFPMSGGRLGLMGEAGAEAIMPLARGSDGRLGVRAQGGGAAPRVEVPISVNIVNAAGAQVTTRSRTTPGGGREIDIRIDALKREIATEYGLSPRKVAR